MAHASYLREKARLMRVERKLTIDELAERLALSRSTQGLNELREFWGGALAIEPDTIKLQRKSNSNQMAGRQWRSRHGVIAVRVPDTLLRARLQAWMDCLRAEWH
jgi:hypothetical protein